MRYRRVPGTELEVSEIGFGTGDTAGGVVYAETRDQIRLVERALELGVNYFDTSPDYGKGLAEANIGRILRDLGARDVFVTTKVEIMPEDLGRIGARVEESINDSLVRLRRDHVDILMLHNPSRNASDLSVRTWTPLTPDLILREVLPALAKAQEAGKARYLGLASERAEASAVERLLATSCFSMMNVWFNLANPSAASPVDGLPENERYDGFFESTRQHGVGVAVIRPLAGGALTHAMLAAGAAGRHPVSRGYVREHPEMLASELERGQRFAFLERQDQTLADAAYRFILANPDVTTIIGGFSEISHIEHAARSSDQPDLSADDVSAIRRAHDSGF